MSEQEVIDLLKQAYTHALRMDMHAYGTCVGAAERALATLPDAALRRTLHGELLLVTAFEHRNNLQRMTEQLHQASQMLKAPSRVIPQGAHLYLNFYDLFGVFNSVAGSAERNAQAVGQMETLLRTMTSGGAGAEACYRAQLAYYQGNLETAQRLAEDAFKQAKQGKQSLEALCAAEVQARTARHTQDAALWQASLEYIESQGSVGAHENSPMAQACQATAPLISMALQASTGVLRTAPDWVREGDFGAVSTSWGFKMAGDRIPAGAFALACMARIECLCYAGKHTLALEAIDTLQKVYGVQSLLTSAYAEFFRAGCYLPLGDKHAYHRSLERAVQLVAPDGLWLIAAEFADAFGDALYTAVAHTDVQALERVKSLGGGFWDKLRRLRTDAPHSALVSLSRRELEVARLAMRGMTSAAIAEELHISVRTVNTHLEHVYRKCGVHNRTQLPAALNKNAVELAFWADGR